ncbi:hypothetical protein IQ235_00355 [Oscillatoriales cyanobacterium LEGE 11467]|uniref:Uncharacterized protein n=1 Tax=Zarconia navalis LEGE 11467 TaxID=1828826 RepID=A0A928Z5F5_9CYAN|nr:hypothetical protein [Zarconia navalis]MBE9039247.1 hypothetical protein [Zarconia navalis LEGE 11467]
MRIYGTLAISSLVFAGLAANAQVASAASNSIESNNSIYQTLTFEAQNVSELAPYRGSGR